jgi:hypothetical protein
MYNYLYLKAYTIAIAIAIAISHWMHTINNWNYEFNLQFPTHHEDCVEKNGQQCCNWSMTYLMVGWLEASLGRRELVLVEGGHQPELGREGGKRLAGCRPSAWSRGGSQGLRGQGVGATEGRRRRAEQTAQQQSGDGGGTAPPPTEGRAGSSATSGGGERREGTASGQGGNGGAQICAGRQKKTLDGEFGFRGSIPAQSIRTNKP